MYRTNNDLESTAEKKEDGKKTELSFSHLYHTLGLPQKALFCLCIAPVVRDPPFHSLMRRFQGSHQL